ncbi:MAG: MFS transporter [Alphaproteobacteria bacterium]|nr:MFS transporter [Alphaproteobacteria bacterium]
MSGYTDGIDAELRRRTMRKVSRRLIPFMIAMFCANFIDRVNIGFAALQMNRDLGLTPEIYGFAAGILFIGYTAFEVPSNIILDKVGARLWLARIMVTWGLIAAANALVFDKYSLYVARTILGIAEAGFFPGIMLYLIRWFPSEERAGAITLFMVGNPISVIFGAPISTAILGMDGTLGLHGWQWLFILEGVPAVVLGIIAYLWLTERPSEAAWLQPEERDWLTWRIASETQGTRSHALGGVWAAFTHGPTLLLAFAKFCVLLAFFGITLWLPQIIKGMGNLTNFETGVVTAIPYIFAAVASIYIGRSSDRTGERAWHVAIPAFVGTLGFALAAYTANPVIGMIGISIATAGLWVSNTVVWTMPAAILAGTPAAASGIALVNSIGNLGGFFGPYFTGWLRQLTNSFSTSLLMLAGFLVLNGIVVLIVGRAIPPARRLEAPALR